MVDVGWLGGVYAIRGKGVGGWGTHRARTGKGNNISNVSKKIIKR